MRGYPGIRGDNEEELTDDGGRIYEQDAERIVRDPGADTQVSSVIEQSVWKRIAEYAYLEPYSSVFSI